MTLAQLKTLLEGKFPKAVAYRAFPVGKMPALPVVVYYCTDGESFAADNITFTRAQNVVIELYTRSKDMTSEGYIETLFTANDIFFDKTETYIDDQHCFETIYSITL